MTMKPATRKKFYTRGSIGMIAGVALYVLDAWLFRTVQNAPPTLLEIGPVKIAAAFPELVFLLSFVATIIPLGWAAASKRGWV